MKTFGDLPFKEWPTMRGVVARLIFDNGFGVSVVRHMGSYGSENGLYELAVLDVDGNLTYDTPITNDVIGRLTPEEVTRIMRDVQQLAPEES